MVFALAQLDDEPGALAELAFGVDRPLVDEHDLLGQSQADARPFLGPRFGAVDLGEAVEYRLQHIGGNADPRILDRHGHGLVPVFEVDRDLAALVCELQGVRQEVEDDLLELVRVQGQLERLRRVLVIEPDLSLVGHRLDRRQERRNELDEIDRSDLEPHLPLLELVQVKEVIDELKQLVAVALHRLVSILENRREAAHLAVKEGF